MNNIPYEICIMNDPTQMTQLQKRKKRELYRKILTVTQGQIECRSRNSKESDELMQEALNVAWTLDDWGRPRSSWGYPNKTAGKCSTNNRVPYCYPSLVKKGKSRWEGLNEWLNKVLIGSKEDQWDKEFNPTISSGIKDNDKNEFNWGQIVDKIIDKIQGNQLVTTHEDHKNRIWTGQEWNAVLNEDTISTVAWHDTKDGKKLLILIVCIFTGLIDSLTEGSNKYPGRRKMCDHVDNALRNSRNKWKSWFGNSGPPPGKATTECIKGEIGGRCNDAAMSLVLTVYTGMSLFCPECGPYYIDRWVTDSGTEEPKSKWYYCGVEDNKLQCDNKGEKDEKSRKLWMSPKNKLGSDCRPNCTQGNQASISGEEQSTKIKGVEMTARSFPGAGRQPDDPNKNTTLKNQPESKRLGTTKRLSTVSDTPIGRTYQTQRDDNRSPSPSSNSGARLTEAREQQSSTSQVDQKKPGESRNQGISPLGGQRNEAVTDNSAITRKEAKSGQEGVGLYSIIGGIIGVLLLGLAGAYGIFRIWGPQRSRGRKKRAFGGRDTMSYGDRSNSGGDKINISVLPVAA
ncbi:hypothetical protein C922_05565 [Plasmodium inui San Antonio 1]|uniref:Uncharacterized protein n=1 Tax=Plasmodium inui San Antonio 1 TaxID=1237626 RepID=W6ZXP5_9APIC|nr:hypothetical protein C922_05565 [Plasmodium inui San Antonio 1]EUD64058.1 hypothetical protein C922_05565 [Plasmodium inui San Antonio 1]